MTAKHISSTIRGQMIETKDQRLQRLAVSQHMARIGLRGGLATKYLKGIPFLQANALKGGLATREKYGPEHYKAMNRKSLARRRQNRLIKKLLDSQAVG